MIPINAARKHVYALKHIGTTDVELARALDTTRGRARLALRRLKKSGELIETWEKRGVGKMRSRVYGIPYRVRLLLRDRNAEENTRTTLRSEEESDE